MKPRILRYSLKRLVRDVQNSTT